MAGKKTDYHQMKKQKATAQIREVLRSLPPLCGDYILSVSSTTSVLTRLAYVHDLRTFFYFLILEEPAFASLEPGSFTSEDLARITLRDLERYQDYLRQYVRPDYSGNALFDENSDDVRLTMNDEAAIARKLSAVRSFFKYLYIHEIIPENVTEKLTMPKLHEKPIIYLDKYEVARMLESAETGEGLGKRQKKYAENTRVRDLAILCLLVGTGIRASELIGMDLDDVDLDNSAFAVTRKGGNRVILYFNDGVKEALEDYLAQRNTIQPAEGHENALFLSLQKKRISTRALQDLVKKYATAAAPLKERLSPHKLRSTFGTNLYRETGDIYLVATSLGHSNVNTTRKHYAAADEDKRRAAAMRVSWVDPKHK
ncbi:MAG: tyrosine-type recombinase/integrase [Clostridia bacterium]|nr:tyrosine-type recombinase/integrase [Clostridia bacterium]